MTAILSGTKYAAIDARGRMSFPAQYLGVLGNCLHITPDTDGLGFLQVNSEEGYQAFLEELKSKYSGSKLRKVLRHVSANTETVEPDKLGRITLPPALCEHAKLNGRVAVIGVGDYAEIWDETRFKEQDAADMDEILKLMAEED